MSITLTADPVARGAEANLYAARFFNQHALVKRRHKKAYRHPTLDAKLRAERTTQEARILAKAALAGVPVPKLLHVDASAHELIIHYIDGTLLSRAIDSLSSAQVKDAAKQCGVALARLHAAGMFHGDATTSNFMVDKKNKIWLIDFGLSGFSSSSEDHAMDLVLFKKSVAEYPGAFAAFWTAYAAENTRLKAKPDAKAILATLGDIEQRGRYVVRSQAGA